LRAPTSCFCSENSHINQVSPAFYLQFDAQQGE
jgi:hypothetical protein